MPNATFGSPSDLPSSVDSSSTFLHDKQFTACVPLAAVASHNLLLGPISALSLGF